MSQEVEMSEEKKTYKLDSGVNVTMTDLKFDDVKVADYSNNAELPWTVVDTTKEDKNTLYAIEAKPSFTFESKIGEDDMKKFINAFSPGKPIMFSGKIDNFSISVGRCDGSGKPTVTTQINGNDVEFNVNECKLSLDFIPLEPDGDSLNMPSRTMVVESHGPICSHTHIDGQGIAWSDEFHQQRHDPFLLLERHKIARAINLEKIIAETKKLKKKNHHWITFQQVTGHWNKTVKAALKGDTKARTKMQDLGNRMICIMGQAWHGENWGGKKGCHMCEYLGYDALRIFTQPTHDASEGHFYTPISMESFNHYKLAFEHHWNTAHADHTRN